MIRQMAPVVLLLAALVGVVSAYADGAPEETCESMNPGHEVRDSTAEVKPLTEPQSGPPFYRIVVDKTKVNPREEVLVTIVANKLYFEGFLIQARDVRPVPSDGAAVKKYGTFTALSNKTQVLCNKTSVTHALHEHFTEVAIKWTAPDVRFENVRFTATVVKGYSTFFMGVHSETLNSGAPLIARSMTALTSVLCLRLGLGGLGAF